MLSATFHTEGLVLNLEVTHCDVFMRMMRNLFIHIQDMISFSGIPWQNNSFVCCVWIADKKFQLAKLISSRELSYRIPKKSCLSRSSGDPYFEYVCWIATTPAFYALWKGERPQWTLFAGAVVTFSNNANSCHGFGSYPNSTHTGDPLAGLIPGAPGLQAGWMCILFQHAFPFNGQDSSKKNPRWR